MEFLIVFETACFSFNLSTTKTVCTVAWDGFPRMQICCSACGFQLVWRSQVYAEQTWDPFLNFRAAVGEGMFQNCGGRKARNFLLCWHYIATSREAVCLIFTAKYIDHNCLLWTAFYIISLCNVNSINANEYTITQLSRFPFCFFMF